MAVTEINLGDDPQLQAEQVVASFLATCGPAANYELVAEKSGSNHVHSDPNRLKPAVHSLDPYWGLTWDVPFDDNVVGRVSDTHLRHRENCEFNKHCAWCVQAGRSTMELRDYRELDAIAEARLMALVKRGHKEATLFYLTRKQRNESLWSRIKVLLGIG